MTLRAGFIVVGLLSLALSLDAQTLGNRPVSVQVPPPLIQFSSTAMDEGGNSMSGVVSITFSLYTSQRGGDALWTETQNLQLDATGHYSAQLGITKTSGVPTALFTSGEARWLGVRIAEQAEQARVLLVSVPYALKAGDAATIGGLPPSAFVMAASPAAGSATEPAGTARLGSGAINVGGTGTTDFIPLWTDNTGDLGNSVMFQSGSGSTAKVGINTTTPATTLDVKGGGTIRGELAMPTSGTATATKGANSQPMDLSASSFNSSTSKAVTQTFQWQAEPAGNDTSSPSGTLNLLFGSGSNKVAETGLGIASNGQINFASGQTVPGGVPSGSFILGSSATAPAGYTTVGAGSLGGGWSASAPLPTPRNGLAVVQLNGLIYAIGGQGTSGVVNTLEVFNPATNTWTTKSSMPTARTDLAAVVVNGEIYAIGGGNFTMVNGTLAAVEMYDPPTDTWTTKAPLPTARYALGAAVVNGQIYAIAGDVFINSAVGSLPSTVVEIYNPTTNTWSTGPSLVGTGSGPGIAGVAAPVANGSIYAIGGYGGGSLPNGTLEIFNSVSNTWSIGTSRPTSTSGADVSADVVSGNIYSVDSAGTVEVYNTATSAWTTAAPLPTITGNVGLTGPGVVALNGFIYAFGSQTVSGVVGGYTELYSPPFPTYIYVKN
jgi:N-acetylneuraminic acid mutarotase